MGSGPSALDALIATAQREEPPTLQQLQIKEIPTRRPLDIQGRDRVRGQPRPRRQRPEGEGRGDNTQDTFPHFFCSKFYFIVNYAILSQF